MDRRMNAWVGGCFEIYAWLDRLTNDTWTDWPIDEGTERLSYYSNKLSVCIYCIYILHGHGESYIPVSQWSPVYPGTQLQVYPLTRSLHTPLFKQGSLAHSSISCKIRDNSLSHLIIFYHITDNKCIPNLLWLVGSGSVYRTKKTTLYNITNELITLQAKKRKYIYMWEENQEKYNHKVDKFRLGRIFTTPITPSFGNFTLFNRPVGRGGAMSASAPPGESWN